MYCILSIRRFFHNGYMRAKSTNEKKPNRRQTISIIFVIINTHIVILLFQRVHIIQNTRSNNNVL